jgi:hypothetical protein
VKFGSKFKLNHFQRQEALARLAAGESQAVVARTYGGSIERPSAGCKAAA